MSGFFFEPPNTFILFIYFFRVIISRAFRVTIATSKQERTVGQPWVRWTTFYGASSGASAWVGPWAASRRSGTGRLARRSPTRSRTAGSWRRSSGGPGRRPLGPGSGRWGPRPRWWRYSGRGTSGGCISASTLTTETRWWSRWSWSESTSSRLKHSSNTYSTDMKRPWARKCSSAWKSTEFKAKEQWSKKQRPLQTRQEPAWCTK